MKIQTQEDVNKIISHARLRRFPTLAEAARAAVLGDYVVVVEGGAMRGLNAEEQAEVERLRKESA